MSTKTKPKPQTSTKARPKKSPAQGLPSSVIVLTPSGRHDEPPKAMLVPVEVAQPGQKRATMPKSVVSERPPPKARDNAEKRREKTPKLRSRKTPKEVSPLSRGWRTGAALGAAILLVIAIARASGPSGWAWSILFGLGAIFGIIIAAGRRVRWSLPAVLALVTGLWALSSLPALAHGEGPPDFRHTLERDERRVLDLGALVLITSLTTALALHLREGREPSKRVRARFKGR